MSVARPEGHYHYWETLLEIGRPTAVYEISGLPSVLSLEPAAEGLYDGGEEGTVLVTAKDREARDRGGRDGLRARVEASLERVALSPHAGLSDAEFHDLVALVHHRGWGTADVLRYQHRVHVLEGREWPEGTTVEEYDRSARRLIEEPGTRVVLSRSSTHRHVTFHGLTMPSELGPAGRTFTVADYNVEEANLMTAFQTSDDEYEFLERLGRARPIWL